MNSNNQSLKVSLLKNYMKPLYKLSNTDTAMFDEIKREISIFVEANKDADVHDYLERAKNKFGHWIEIADKSIMIDKISSIEAKIKFFFILSIISIVVSIIVAIATTS